jgi:hypothetical protein
MFTASSIAAFAAIAGATATAAPSGGAYSGPTTNKKPYVLPVADGVSTISLLTVGDKPAENDYKMVGIPDGLGAVKTSSGSFDLFMNHELPAARGKVRRHGQKGAFVSKLEINSRSLAVEEGSDFINPGVTYWDYTTQTYGATPSAGGTNPRNPADTFEAQLAPFNRFCSSSLTDPGQLYNGRSGRGYRGQIYFGNEEGGDNSRSFGVTLDGTAQQLPRLGLFSWENTLAAANRTDTTLVQGQEDAATGQLRSYVGTKTKKGNNAFSRAGLTNGTDFVVDAVDETVTTDAEFRSKYDKGEPAEVDLSEVDWDQSAEAQNREAAADGLTLNRIEDGAWDPRNPDDFYFVTTEGGLGADVPTGATGRDGGGLWRLSYEDIEQPELGGTLTLLLDGSEEPKLNKPDNMDIDSKGNLLIQEDPGNNVSLARIVAYRIKDGARGVVAQFDPALFTEGQPDFITRDEESSGIIDAKEILGSGWFLLDAQVHLARVGPDDEEVEEGQLLAMRVKSWSKVYGDKHGDDD